MPGFRPSTPPILLMLIVIEVGDYGASDVQSACPRDPLSHGFLGRHRGFSSLNHPPLAGWPTRTLPQDSNIVTAVGRQHAPPPYPGIMLRLRPKEKDRGRDKSRSRSRDRDRDRDRHHRDRCLNELDGIFDLLSSRRLKASRCFCSG